MRSIINHALGSKSSKSGKGGSLANIVLHMPDLTKTDACTLYRAISRELGEDIAEEYGKRLYQAFTENAECGKTLDAWSEVDPPPSPCVDARHIIATYKAAISAGTAFYNPRRLVFILLADFALDSQEVTNKWHLKDILGVISIASTCTGERMCTAGLLKKSILRHSKPKQAHPIVTLEQLNDALTTSILDSFRDQVLAKLTSKQRLDILAVEEVSTVC